jgi:hypothetical protein
MVCGGGAVDAGDDCDGGMDVGERMAGAGNAEQDPRLRGGGTAGERVLYPMKEWQFWTILFMLMMIFWAIVMKPVG